MRWLNHSSGSWITSKTNEAVSRWIQSLPKAEIHVHLEGSIAPEVLLDIAHRHGLREQFPTLEAVYPLYRFSEPNDFFQRFLTVSDFVHSPDDLVSIVNFAGQQLIQQNCLYVEWTYAPQKFVSCGIPYWDQLQAIELGMSTLSSKLEYHIIIDLVRNLGEDEALRTMAMIRKYPHPRVTGIGLGGTENYEAAMFTHAFNQARELGLGITAHAGESGGPMSIRETLRLLGVKRIDHGVRAIEDPNLVNQLAQSNIVLNLCPTSNFRLGLFSSPAQYPLRQFLDAGIPITLGSDDPPFFETTLTLELERAILLLGMTPLEIVQSQHQAIEASFLPDDLKLTLHERMMQEIGSIPSLSDLGLPERSL